MVRLRRAFVLAICVGIGFAILPAEAQLQPQRPGLPNFDSRFNLPPQALRESPALQSAVSRLRERDPSIQVEFDELLATPKVVRSGDGFLTGPGGEGRSISAQTARLVPADDPYRAVKNFLNEHSALFGHGAEALADARTNRDFVAAHNGMRSVVWQQQVDDITVFEAVLIAHTTRNGELVNVSSGFLPDARRAADAGIPNRAVVQAAPPISAQQAVALSARNVGETLDAATVSAVDTISAGAEKRQRFRASVLLGDTDARLVWLPLERARMRLCWEVILTSRARGEMFRVLIDAQTGEPMVRHGLTDYISDATYRVYTSDSPSPYSPGCPTPCTTQPALISRSMVTLSAIDTTASPNGWINDGNNTTLGNNVDAHLDKNGDNVPDPGSRPTGSPFRVFDFGMDLAQEPVTYTNAAVVQLFYWNNWMHDKLYGLGFTEAAGNFQTDNFGRGGLGNDAVQADAQDGSGTDNANFSTPPDGSAPRMQMYLFTGPTPDRDGDFDADVVLHEYTHGLSNRRVGGGVGISALQTGGMGEGWSDFYGLSLLSEPGDDVNGSYAAGGYVTYQLSGMTQNYYFGIRRYPYTTDMTKNPLTFKDIDPAQASSHSGIPRSPIIGTAANEVHNMGEVWCVTLWEARANLITKYGFAVGNQRILQLVTDGMNLSPANPNFLQARDAIIQADLVDTGGANRNDLWSAFARRGMGFHATSPSSSTTTGLVEAYDVPDDLAVSPQSDFSARGPQGGPFTPASTTYTLRNTGTSTLTWVAAKTQPWLDIAPSSGTLTAGGSITVTVALNAGALSLPLGVYSDTVRFTNVTSGVVQSRAAQLRVEGYASMPFTETWESGTFQPYWTVTGTATYRSQVTTANGPHAGLYHLTMDSSVDDNYSRNEVTLGINLANYTNVVLTCWAKGFNDEPNGPPPSPFIGGADFDGIAISADGNTWWEVRGLRSIGNSWIQLVVNLDAALAAHGLNYNSTFHVRFNQYDNYGISTDGIAIDDISITGALANRLAFTVPSAATEGDGVLAGQGRVTATPAPGSDLTVTLTSSDTSEVTVPATVTVLAGQTNATFDVTVVDDTDLDGDQTATITAAATGYASGSGTMIVHDNETATLAVTLPASATEGQGVLANAGTVTVNAPVAANVAVNLTSSDTTEVVVPSAVTILAGQTSAAFNVTIVDDNQIDGPQTATVTAHVPNWTDGSASMTVLDNENANLTVSLPASAYEGDGVLTNAGSVSISGTWPSDLLVNLVSGNTGKVLVPATVTIPAGQTSAAFNITIVDNTIPDGTQTATVTASATSFLDGSATIAVKDNEVYRFVFSSIGSFQSAGTPFAVSIAAVDINSSTITVYRSTVNLSGAGNSGPVSIQPTSTTAFNNGVWTGSVQVNTLETNIRLTADDGGGHTGTSNPFNVLSGPLDHFGWNVVPSPQHQDVPFPVTVTAQDAGNNSVPGFTNTVSLSGIRSLVPTSNMILGNPVPNGSANSGIWTLGYSFTLTTNVTVTHVRHYSGNKVSIWSDSGFLLASQPVTSVPGTWVETPLATPIQLVAGVTYRVGVYTAGATYYDRNDLPATFPYGTIGQSYEVLGDAFPTGFDGARWWFVDLRYALGNTTAVAISPTISGNFVGGVWAGAVTVLERTTNMWLRADDGAGHSGTSTPFAVEAFADLAVTMTYGPDPVYVGSNLPYSVTIVNSGPDKAAGVVLTDPLPSGVTFVSVACSPGTGTLIGNTVICDLGIVSNGAAATATIVVRPTAERILTNTVTLTSTATDPNLANNVATTITTVQGVGVLGVAANITNAVPASAGSGTPFGTVIGGFTYPYTATGTAAFSVQPLYVDPDGSPYGGNTADTSYLCAGLKVVSLVGKVNGVCIQLGSGGSFVAPSTGELRLFMNDAIDGFDDNSGAWSAYVGGPFELTFSGKAGGPFNPSSQVCSLTNSGTGSLSWSAGTSQNWLSLSPTSGTLAAGTGTNTILTINSNANGLAVGQYSSVVTFTNQTNGNGTTARSVALAVLDPGLLTVTPTNALNAAETRGGPFTPSSQVYTLGNAGGTPLNWSATKSASWLSLSATNGMLPPSAATTVMVSINASANSLAAGSYSDTVTFNNATDGAGNALRNVALTVIEDTNLVVNLPASAYEGDGALTNAGKVAILATRPADVLVNLVSSQTGKVVVPATVTISAGQTMAAFNVTIVDNTVPDGTQTATVTASASGFIDGSANIAVKDNDVYQFGFSGIGSPQFAGAPFPVSIAALDINSSTITVYRSTVNLSGAGDSGSVSIQPTSATAFNNGVWTGSVQVNTFDTNIRLTADDGGGHTGTSNPFNVLSGPLDHFGWSVVSSPQHLDAPFPVTVTARDASNHTVPTFTDAVVLSAVTLGWTNNTILGNRTDTSAQNNGTYTLGYSFTPSTNLLVTHVRHYSGSKVSIWTDTGVLVASQMVTSVPGTWMETPLANPVQLAAGARYRVGVYTGGATYYARGDIPTTFPYGTINQSYDLPGDTFPTTADTARWWFVDLRYSVGVVLMTPTSSGGFVSGIWTGAVTVLETTSNIWLRADDGAGHSGTSTPFAVEAFADVGVEVTGAPNPVDAGSNLTYSATVTNGGPGRASGVVLTDPLPSGVTFVSATASQGSCTQIAGVVTCSFGNLSNSAVATATIVIRPPLEGMVTNTVTLATSAIDPNPANNVATAVTTVQGTGILDVTPVSGLTSVGPVGGPFGPSSQVYSVTNSGTGSLSWSAANTANWVSLSSAGGSLAPRTATNVSVSINGNANILGIGSYSDSVVFTNLTNGNGTTSRDVSLTVNAPANLSVTPVSGLNSTGIQGGPFTPSSQAYTLSNAGGSPLNWSASKSTSWVGLSATSGSLAAGSNALVTVSINANANSLAHGSYNDTVTFTNITNGVGNTPRDVTLTISENTNLTVSLPASAYEGDGVLTNAGRVSIVGTRPADVLVNLVSSQTGKVLVPATVTIFSGQTSAVFNVTIVDNSVPDGTQIATVTASASGFIDGSADIAVNDNDVYQFGFSVIASPQSAGMPFALSIAALDINGSTITVYRSAVNLSGAGHGGAVSIQPTNTTAFGNGVWTGNVRVNTADTNVRLTADDGLGHTGISNPFNVQSGPLDHFGWSMVSSPQRLDVPFPVTITAQDAGNSTVISFANAVNLSGVSDLRLTNSTILGNPTPSSTQNNGAYTLGYSFTPATNVTVTHVRHYSGTKVSIWTDTGVLVASRMVTSVPGTWVETPLANPVQLAAGTRYRVGVYTGGTTYYGRGNLPTTFPYGTINQSYDLLGDTFPTTADTARWWFVDLRYSVGVVLMTPTSSGGFVSGIWTGAVTVLETTSNMWLRADDGAGHSGTSTPFAVQAFADLAATMTDAPSPVDVGGNLTYSATVTNGGPDRAGGVVLTDPLPSGVTFVSATASQGSCMQIAGVVTCNLSTLNNGAVATAAIVVRPTVEWILTNTVTVSSSVTDLNPANNAATAITTVQGVGVLAVTPSSGLTSTGPVGGPFAPASQVYSVTNSGTGSLTWSAANSANWVSLSSAGGSLAPRTATNVTVSLNGNANTLGAGSYSDSVTFTNLTNGNGNTTRGVALTVNPPAVLSVTPAGDLNSSGPSGGPFTPPSQTYTLSNTGGSPLNWTASKSASWVSLSATSGSLAAGSNALVTVSINANANALGVGSYSDSVTFANFTNGNGTTTRGVALTVIPPAVLSVTPAGDLNSSGPSGGPFTPPSQTYTLSNTGGSPLNWTASKSASWVSLSATSGSLAAGSNALVTVSINANANGLAAGVYNGSVAFTNVTNRTGSATRIVTLTVSGLAISNLVVSSTSGTDNGRLDPNECNQLSIVLNSYITNTLSSVTALLSSTTPGITMIQGTAAYPDIAPGQTASNLTPFRISTTPAFNCRSESDFVLTLTYTSGSQTSTFSLPPPVLPYAISQSTGAVIVPGTTDIGHHCASCVSTTSLPFPYIFYGQTYTNVVVSSNGNLQFASAWVQALNTCLPVSGLGPTIFAHWDYLLTDGSGDGVFTSVSGAAPNRIFNIEWRAKLPFGGQSVNFEVRLYEGDQKLSLVYGVVDGSASVTVGIQNSTDSFTQFECNSGGLTNGLQLTFAPSCADGGGACDSDGDGIPDYWMLQYFGHPTGQAGDHSRAGDDADGDGLTNLQEFLAGTDPTNNASTWRIQASPTNGVAPLAVSFTENSTGLTITNRLWSFGDGGTSSEIGPVHTYTSVGTYSVGLSLFNTYGTATLVATNLVTVSPFSTIEVGAADLQDRFGDLMPTNGLAVLVADRENNGFTDLRSSFALSLGATWGTDDKVVGLWDLSTQGTPGLLYDLVDVVYSGGIAAGQQLQLYWFPSLTLASNTLGVTYYGKYTDTNSPPLDSSDPWMLPAPGSYARLLFITQSQGGSNPDDEGRATLSTIVSAWAGFTASTTHGAAPLAVTFTDTSTGAISDRFWDFGDSSTTNFGSATNPQHTYGVGTYTVTLVVSGAGGVSTNLQLHAITALTPFAAWQQQYFGCTACPQAAAAADPDGDGQTNLMEFQTGTDPTNSASAFRIIGVTQEGDDIRVTWTTGGGRTNVLEAAAGDATGSYTNGFVDVNGVIVISGSGDTTTNSVDTGGATNTPSRYYRIRFVP